MDITRLDHVRILMYSHDTFGLGHLRRCRAIAHAIVEQFKGVSILIISGSQIAGAFDFKARVDFVKIPSVIKLYNGQYDSIGEYIEIDEILEMRQRIIQRTAEAFQPDIFIVDKEPLGLKGELVPTLEMFKQESTTTILGLRDVMDSPELLKKEWTKSGLLGSIDEYYDRVWVYGPDTFWNPLEGFEVSESLKQKQLYVGFLNREAGTPALGDYPGLPEKFILVMAGGGGDGSTLMEQVLSAREHDRSLDFPIVLVLGPFMKTENRDRIRWRASHLANINVIDFENRIEQLLIRCEAMVGMCGYNTFCEAISFDKRALFIPRTVPREEQYIRASRATELGLSAMLEPSKAAIPSAMAEKLRALPNQILPSTVLNKNDLDGLANICRDVAEISSKKKEVKSKSDKKKAKA